MGTHRDGGTVARAPGRGPLPRAPGLARTALRLAGLSALVLAWPVLDVLRRDAAFFAVRRSPPQDILALLAAALLGPPLLATAVVAAARGAHRRLGGAVEGLLVAALVAIGALGPLTDALDAPALASAAATLAGLGAALAVARSAAARSLLDVLALAPLVVAIAFVADGQVARLLRPADPPPLPQVTVTSRTPLVMLVLDELPTGSLMDGAGAIDRRLFPNFAALADTSTWFRNASTVHTNTVYVVPALLTGMWPGDPGLLPVHADHPRNLFTILAGSHRMHVVETVTSLCPEALLSGPSPGDADGAPADGRGREGHARPPGRRPPPPFAARMAALLADVSVVAGHVLLPDAWTGGLPDVTATWGGFLGSDAHGPAGLVAPGREGAAAPPGGDGAAAAGRGVAAEVLRDELVAATREDRSAIFDEFIEAIDAGDGNPPGLHFLHVLLPHSPWRTLPSGLTYPGAALAIGFVMDVWLPDPWVVAQGLQRHLLQVGNVDRQLGRLMARCRQVGLWDDAVVVVVADHGAAFRPGDHRRHAGPDNWEELFWAPLFIKSPGQTRGVVDDRPVETIDVLPTVLDALGVSLPWALDGASAWRSGPPPRPGRRLHALGGGMLEPPNAPPQAPWPVAGSKRELFGEGAGWDEVFALSTRPELVGRRAASLPRGPPPAVDVQLETGDLFGAVAKRSGLVPAMVRGVVQAPSGGAPPGAAEPPQALELAVAIDGTIRAVTRTFTRRDGGLGFLAMVSDDLLRDGANPLEVFVVTGAAGDWRLSPVDFARYRLEHDASATWLRGRDGRIVPVVAGALQGRVDQARRVLDTLRLVGWAAEATSGRPVDSLIVLRDGVSVFRGTTGRPEPAEDPVPSGAATGARPEFVIDIPWSVLGERASGHLAVFAQRGELASELAVSRAANWIAQVQHRREGDELVGADGRRLPITRGRLAGSLDRAEVRDRRLILAGWAADVRRADLVEQVLVLADDRQVLAEPTGLERPDVADRHGPAVLASGFRLALPLAWLGEPPARRVEVFAVARGRALRLPPGPAAAWLDGGLAAAPPEAASTDGDR